MKYAALDHISVYDNDASVGKYIKELLPHPNISYYPNWGGTDAMSREARGGRDHYACTETYAENQCIWNARGVSEWALLLHNNDGWLAVSNGGKDFQNELDTAPLHVS